MNTLLNGRIVIRNRRCEGEIIEKIEQAMWKHNAELKQDQKDVKEEIKEDFRQLIVSTLFNEQEIKSFCIHKRSDLCVVICHLILPYTSINLCLFSLFRCVFGVERYVHSSQGKLNLSTSFNYYNITSTRLLWLPTSRVSWCWRQQNILIVRWFHPHCLKLR